MTRPNSLLKVVSILLIVFSAIAIVLVLLASTFAGSLVGMLYDMAGLEGGAGAGLATGAVIFVLAILGSVLNLIAGILGVKAKFTGCKALGIFLLVCAVIGAVLNISMFDPTATSVVTTLLRIVLPALYVWGAFKGPAAE